MDNSGLGFCPFFTPLRKPPSTLRCPPPPTPLLHSGWRGGLLKSQRLRVLEAERCRGGEQVEQWARSRGARLGAEETDGGGD